MRKLVLARVLVFLAFLTGAAGAEGAPQEVALKASSFISSKQTGLGLIVAFGIALQR